MYRLKPKRFASACVLAGISVLAAAAEPITVGAPLAAVNEAGETVPISPNVKVFGSFHFAESCTYDPARDLVLVMNAGVRRGDAAQRADGYVSLINPDGSVHTAKWIGAERTGLDLNDPLGSAIADGILYTVDGEFVRRFDLDSGQPLEATRVEGSTFLNGIAVAADGTLYVSNTRPSSRLYRITPDGRVDLLLEGAPLAAPNGVAMDPDGNPVVVNIDDDAVLTFDREGTLLRTERAAQKGSDGLVIVPDGTKYVSSVRHGSVSRIRPGQDAEVIARGIPSAASMCHDSRRNQLVIPMNPNNAIALVPLSGAPALP
ncbi:MAG: SMP-30/gluconolactonase/LRE family protein [Pseudomonadales bacterium]|jgi:DNA-binding beta-propeller fold protein YncE|nr:SMP-30/gluconolactonase/LRE family protein [Pseudomonadales bacterium]